MKVYRVLVETCDYDEWDSAIFLADSPEEALAMLKPDGFDGEAVYADGDYDHVVFYKHQGKITIEEITTKGLALASFNAG